MIKSVLKGLQFVLLISAFVVMAYLLRKDFQADHFQSLLQQASLYSLAVAIGAAFLGLLLKIIRLVDMCRAFKIPLTIKRSFDIQVISISLGIITPGRAGELSKVFLLSEGSNAPAEAQKKAFFLMVIERLMDMFVLALLSTCFLMYTFPHLRYQMLALATGGSLVTGLMGFKLYPRFKSKLSWVSSGGIFRWFLLSLAAWSFDGLFQLFILASIHLHPNVLKVITLNAIVAIAGVLSVLPVGLGTVDLSALYLYNHSVNLQQSEIIYLLAAGRVLGLGLLFGLFALVLLKHPGLYQRLKAKRAHE